MSVKTRRTVDGVTIELETWSDSAATDRPLLLLHEGLGSIAMWRDFPARLAARTGHPVIAYSRQGHGWSDRMTDVRSPDFMHEEAERLNLLIEAHGWTTPVLIGHSDGASIAILHASRFAAVSTVLLAPHVFVEPFALKSIREAKTRFEQTDMRDRLGRYHIDPEHTFWTWNTIWLSPEFAAWNIEAETALIKTPLLVIQGRDDEYGTQAQFQAIARAAPQTDVLELGRCGHSPHRDRPKLTLEAIAAFVAATAS